MTQGHSESAKTRPRKRWLKWFEAKLFARHSAYNLAVIRLLVGGYAMWFLRRYQYSIVRTCTETGAEHFSPVGVASFLSEPLAPTTFVFLFSACALMAPLFFLGAFHRIVGPVFGLLFLFVVTYRQSWGFVYHTENLLVLHVGVLGFSPAAQVLSLDKEVASWNKTLRKLLLVSEQPAASWRFGWPVQLMILVTGVAYWVAGMAKLGQSGLSWATDAQLLDHIGNNALRYHFFAKGASEFTYVAYSLPAWVWPTLAILSLALEIGAPFSILNEKLALLIALSLFGFHWGILKMMGIPFMYQLCGVAYACFIRWDKVIHLAGRLCRIVQARVTRSTSPG